MRVSFAGIHAATAVDSEMYKYQHTQCELGSANVDTTPTSAIDEAQRTVVRADGRPQDLQRAGWLQAADECIYLTTERASQRPTAKQPRERLCRAAAPRGWANTSIRSLVGSGTHQQRSSAARPSRPNRVGVSRQQRDRGREGSRFPGWRRADTRRGRRLCHCGSTAAAARRPREQVQPAGGCAELTSCPAQRVPPSRWRNPQAAPPP